MAAPCSHPVVYHNMCAICQADLTNSLDMSVVNRRKINVVHSEPRLEVNMAEGQRIAEEHRTRLRRERRLTLILDLDETLVHATIDSRAEGFFRDHEKTVPDLHRFNVPPDKHTYFLKVRPGVRDMLQRLKPHYEMHVYTAASERYARQVARIIDPDDTLFGGRIVWRNAELDTPGVTEEERKRAATKNLERLFHCDRNMTVIIDDRPGVWGTDAHSVVRCRPYQFFPHASVPWTIVSTPEKPDGEAVADDASASPALAIANSALAPTADTTGQLRDVQVMEELLLRLPTVVFDQNIAIHRYLDAERVKILAGCRIGFSIKSGDSLGELPHIVKTLGGKTVAISGQLMTHLVVVRPVAETSAVLSKGLMIVDKNWLFECAFMWQHVDEVPFLKQPIPGDDAPTDEFANGAGATAAHLNVTATAQDVANEALKGVALAQQRAAHAIQEATAAIGQKRKRDVDEGSEEAPASKRPPSASAPVAAAPAAAAESSAAAGGEAEDDKEFEDMIMNLMDEDD